MEAHVPSNGAFELSAHTKEGKSAAIIVLSGQQSSPRGVFCMAFSVPPFARHHRVAKKKREREKAISPCERSHEELDDVNWLSVSKESKNVCQGRKPTADEKDMMKGCL